ncbi:hypothetical protein OG21DRAFT_1423541, partial [Imleria badia]
ILCITCDNASNNNMMIEELGEMLLDFGGASTHAWCFLHTTNLVVKALRKEFDAKPNKRRDIGVVNMDDIETLSANEA